MKFLLLFAIILCRFHICLANDEFKYPENFGWCTATAAHEVEGDNTNSDWWAWELIPGKIKDGDRSGKACDEWRRVKQDIALMKNLGVNQYRFSVEWAKIEPEQGAWNKNALSHYKREIELLLESGIEPLVTLNHFTLPLWFAKLGGWANPNSPELFEKYVEKVVLWCGLPVKTWITFNEPVGSFAGGYIAGIVPPGRTDFFDLHASPLVNLLQAHANAYHLIHKFLDVPGSIVQVGMAHHLRVFEPKRAWNPLDLLAAKTVENLTNWDVPDALQTGVLKIRIPFFFRLTKKIHGLQGTQDYIGVNYYMRTMVAFTGKKPLMMDLSVKEGVPTTDVGSEIYPEGFYKTLMRIKNRYPGIPILVTENGVADSKDRIRTDFIRTHLNALERAMTDGAPVRNYCHWSLLDNFEWLEGFTARYGLYEMDYATQTRTLRPSGIFFSNYIQASHR